MEQELEQNLIDKLISQDYEAIELKGPQDLKDNLKRQIEKANDINLSNCEFTNLYNQLIATSTVFTASSILRDRFLFEREDTTKINLLLYNKDSWCKNTFQVARQIKNPHGNTFKKYDVTIFSNWAVALQEYRNYFLENPYGIDYYFFIDSQGSVITVQIFDSEQTHLNVVNQSFYNDFIAARQAFANLIDVTFEIKKSSTELGLIDSYETADAAFNVI